MAARIVYENVDSATAAIKKFHNSKFQTSKLSVCYLPCEAATLIVRNLSFKSDEKSLQKFFDDNHQVACV
jgi:RNA recognition motif-containing protein